MIISICTLAKNENKYLREWVEHHLSLGFNVIYIYDNNGLDGEKVSDVVSDYPEVVVIEKYRGVREKNLQERIYTEFWHEYRKDSDWVAFIDVDEFIMLEDRDTIQDFLSQDKFSAADVVRLRWKVYGDNGLFDVVDGDYRCIPRFKVYNNVSGLYENRLAKSIFRTVIDIRDNAIEAHGCYKATYLNVVGPDGEPCLNDKVICTDEKEPYRCAWVNHYMTKTIGEYARQKMFRGDINGSDSRYSYGLFWRINTFTKAKLDYANKVIEEMKRII
jgi:hypothetical protein